MLLLMRIVSLTEINLTLPLLWVRSSLRILVPQIFSSLELIFFLQRPALIQCNRLNRTLSSTPSSLAPLAFLVLLQGNRPSPQRYKPSLDLSSALQATSAQFCLGPHPTIRDLPLLHPLLRLPDPIWLSHREILPHPLRPILHRCPVLALPLFLLTEHNSLPRFCHLLIHQSYKLWLLFLLLIPW